ncbi:hypothetical protein LR48_Vigan04g181200 [Vigna angularis]|uniref:Uncharacterized protein n=1 Tax=Phaseolus angularis TaxID=3914 RepID=A0A0L9UGD5_PHAAN|nr:hypothetical protein LR48_Vigan04g181200 [Vigna angularis]
MRMKMIVLGLGYEMDVWGNGRELLAVWEYGGWVFGRVKFEWRMMIKCEGSQTGLWLKIEVLEIQYWTSRSVQRRMMMGVQLRGRNKNESLNGMLVALTVAGGDVGRSEVRP